MTTSPPDDLDPRFAAGLRAALVSQVAASRVPSRRRARRRPLFVGLGLSAGLLLAGGSAAAISGLLGGADEVTTYGTAVTQTSTGTAEIDLGPRPAGATHVTIEFECLSAGTFAFADGPSGTCGPSDAGWSLISTILALTPDETGTTVTTSADARWTATVQYASVETTPWGVNSAGQTYGMQNKNGTPDLIGIVASNGLRGYAYATDLNNPWAPDPEPTSPEHAIALQEAHAGKQARIPVYESDGTTVIGEFVMG